MKSRGLLQVDANVTADTPYLIAVTGRSVSGRFTVTDEMGEVLHTFARVWEEQTRETFRWRPTGAGRQRLMLAGNGTISRPELSVIGLDGVPALVAFAAGATI